MFFWLSVSDPFGEKKIEIKATEKQIRQMIDRGFESFQIDVVNEVRTVKIANTFWNRRKLKKLKIDFKE